MIFIFYSNNTVIHGFFFYVESFMYPRDTTHLVFMPFIVLLNLTCYYLDEDFMSMFNDISL